MPATEGEAAKETPRKGLEAVGVQPKEGTEEGLPAK